MGRSKRILFIGTLPPPVHGSAVVSQQIKDSTVINEAFDGDWVNLSTSRRMDEIGKKTLAKPFRLLGALCREFWLLLTHRYDLCYLAITCHGSGFLKDSPFVLMAKLFRKKIVIHQHNKGMANDVNRWPYRWLLPLCYKNAKVILLSWYLYPDIEKVVKKEDVFICPNGIKVQDSPETWNKKPETNRVPRLLFLSNLIESKGVLVLLDALKILKDKGYSFICDFVGGETKEIDAKRFNEEVEKRGLNEIAIYQGRKYGEEKEEVFEQADVFVLPTYNETFGLVNLEAMAHKKPVVSTNEGGIPDVIKDGENGLVSEKKNPDSLAQCIGKLLASEELREKMGADGYKKLREQFTEEKFEANLLQIVSDICVSGGGKFSVCIYHGKMYGDAKKEMLSKANVFVLPTMNDCFPLVILEAMENGLPVVTTPIGGIPDIVDDEVTGLITEDGDAKSLANNLSRLLKDKDLATIFGENGRKKLLEKYTEKSFERTLSETLTQALGGGKIVESLEINVQSCAVRYLGKRYGDEKEQLFESADIFVFPTYYSNECFPLVLLEAMQHELPCVTTDEGGIRDIVVKDSGFTVHGTTPQETAEKTADALEKLIVNADLRKKMGESGRKKLMKEFTEGVFEENMLKILGNVL